MMELVEERQELDENEIHARVERMLHIVQENISAPVIKVYKEKLNATLDLQALRGILEAIDPELPKDALDENALLEQLDLNAWLSLILGRWGLFEPILKNTGRNSVQTLKDIYSRYANDILIVSVRDARNVALSAYELLTEFNCKEAASKVALIRDEVLGLPQSQDMDTDLASQTQDAAKVPTASVIRHKWLGVHSTSEQPIVTENNHNDGKNSPSRIDSKRTKLVKPPSDYTFLKLEIVEKGSEVFAQTIDLKKPSLIIGRSQVADIELNDPLVSRVHLLITGTTPIDIKVTDLNSSNGTCLDGIPLKPNEAAYWDVGKPLVIGETWMILRQA